MAEVKQWGFFQVPRGSISALARSVILIGYPFLLNDPTPPDPVVVASPILEEPLTYYRKYMADLRSIPSPAFHGIVSISSYPLFPAVDITYFRKYLGNT